MRGQRVLTWHPDSPGSVVLVYRPWWRRKMRPFATLSEVLTMYRWRQDHPDFIDARPAR